jgi:RHS repeat-associated protein
MTKIRIPLPGGGQAVYNGGTLAKFNHPDWQGNIRVASKAATQTLAGQNEYTPFGMPYNNGTVGAAGPSFNQSFGDVFDSHEYDALNRELHPVQGRWIQPDPAGLSAVDPSNPQTWNRYASVGNNPLSFVDPSGLLMDPACAVNGDGCGGGGNSDITDPNYSPSSSLLDSPVAVLLGDPFGFPGWDNISEVFGQTSVWNGERWISLGSSGPDNSGINLNRDDGMGGGGAAGSCSQGGSGTFGTIAHMFAQGNRKGSSKKGQNSCSRPTIPNPVKSQYVAYQQCIGQSPFGTPQLSVPSKLNPFAPYRQAGSNFGSGGSGIGPDVPPLSFDSASTELSLNKVKQCIMNFPLAPLGGDTALSAGDVF